MEPEFEELDMRRILSGGGEPFQAIVEVVEGSHRGRA